MSEHSFLSEFFKNPFADGLNNHQKRAILGSLFVIAEIDQEINIKEEEVIEHMIKLMAINLSLPFFQIPATSNEIYESISVLDRFYKEWLLKTMSNLICSDGEPNIKEITCLLDFADDMDISEIELRQIINS